MTAWIDRDYMTYRETVTPFEVSQVNPASYDLRLGNTLRRAHPLWGGVLMDGELCMMASGGRVPVWIENYLSPVEYDAYETAGKGFVNLPRWREPEEFAVAVLLPGEFVLCHSLETIAVPNNCLAMLYSKSSTGRNGLEHLHAGLGDPGFTGQWTWEFHNVAPWPIRLEAGQRLMQHVFLWLAMTPARTYAETGRYQGQQGPTPAR